MPFILYLGTVQEQKPYRRMNMSRLKWIPAILCSILFINCEKQIYLEAGLTWSDDVYFEQSGDWYLAVSEGCYSNCEGATLCVVDQFQVTPGTNTIERFVLGDAAEGNITSFVYLDVNQNGTFDDGYDHITGYKFNYSGFGEVTSIAVSAYF
jgi:hypothetical protein